MSWLCCGTKKTDKNNEIKKVSVVKTDQDAEKQREKLVRSAKVSNVPIEGMQSERPVKGMDNLGNTCYINAAIECLSNTKELTEYMLGGQWQKEANAVNPIGTDGQLLVQYVKLMHKLWESSGGKYITAKEFKECLDQICTTVFVF